MTDTETRRAQRDSLLKREANEKADHTKDVTRLANALKQIQTLRATLATQTRTAAGRRNVDEILEEVAMRIEMTRINLKFGGSK